MQRSAYHSVTSLPVLVPAKREEDFDGIANFLPPKPTALGVEGIPVRLVTDRDTRGAQQLKRIFTSREELDLLTGTMELKYGHDHNDTIVLRRAYFKVWPWVASRPGNDPSDEAARRKAFSEIYGKDKDWAERWYPRIVSEMMSTARLVMWFSNKHQQFLPAIYCPGWRSAAFVQTFLGRIRSCPHCGKLFVPSKVDTDYCSPKHRDAHRLARWRANKKEKAHGASKKR